MAFSFLPLRILVHSYVSLPSVPFPLPRIPLPFVCAPLLSSLLPSRLLFPFCYARDMLINQTHSTHTLLALYLLALYLLRTLYNCFALGLTRTDAVHGRGLRSRGISRAEGAEGPGEPPQRHSQFSLDHFHGGQKAWFVDFSVRNAGKEYTGSTHNCNLSYRDLT
ncbi:hypothetical protein B0H14DRAFT_1092766 [Mycena olivaceomarginata]|nr:hypothetical protein B0H14DRAFT_1092766 [Mycena olivaceomarginata]